MDKKALLALNTLSPLSLEKLKSLAPIFTDTKAVLRSSRSDLMNVGISPAAADRFIAFRDSRASEEELRLLEKHGVSLIDFFSPQYPEILKQISHPPILLYVKGNPHILSEVCFAIVGSRLATIYGMTMAEKFSFFLSQAGLVIVSGLARGIDTAAHKAALRQGKTIAVLGSGLLNIYPRENKKMAEAITDSGALVSEFFLRQPPFKENFPRRNRIISGLSKGVLIAEAALKSGALITAHYALEQNRDVFALPGKANSPLSRGTHQLIKEGACLVDTPQDIIEAMNLGRHYVSQKMNLTPDEQRIFDIIGEEGMSLETLLTASGVSRSRIDVCLLVMQTKGVIQEQRPLYYIRKQYG